MPIIGIVAAVLTLVEQGVITATRAKALIRQGHEEGWDEDRWRSELTSLAETSDAMFADTQAMLAEIASQA